MTRPRPIEVLGAILSLSLRGPRQALPAAPAPLPTTFASHWPVTVVSREARDEIFSICPGGWDRFSESYPGTRGYLTLSRNAFAPEGHEALVYTEEHCGRWCAEGSFVLLRRVAGEWRVQRKLALWVTQ